MQFIPAQVIFNDKEKAFLKDYISEWDEDGRKREAIDATDAFDVCTVKENDVDVRGFKIVYGEDANDVSYVSFQGLETHIVQSVTADDTSEADDA